MSAALWIVIGAGTIISLFTLLGYWVHQGFNEMEDLLEEKSECAPLDINPPLQAGRFATYYSVTKEALVTTENKQTICVLYNLEHDCLYLLNDASIPLAAEDPYIGVL